MTGWRPQVGSSLELEALSSNEPLELAWPRLWLCVTDFFQGATQSFAPKLVFCTQGTHLPNSRVHLRKLVIPENLQRETPVSLDGSHGAKEPDGNVSVR